MGQTESQFLIKNGVLQQYQGQDETVIIPEGVETIDRGALSDMNLAKTIILPSTLKHIKGSVVATDYYGYNYNLNKVVIPSLEQWLSIDFDDDKATLLEVAGNLYIGDELLTSLTVTGDHKVLKPNLFSGCKSLKKVVLEEGVEEIGHGCFNESGLEEISLPESLTSLGKNPIFGFARGTFFACDKLKEVVIPKNVKEIPEECFARCNNLERIVLNEGLERISQSSFSGCDSLKSLTCPNTLKELCLNDLNSLERLELNEGLEKLDLYCLKSLEEVTFPSSLKHISRLEELNRVKSLSLPKHLEFDKNFLISENSFEHIYYTDGRIKTIFGGIDLIAHNGAYYLGDKDNPYQTLFEVFDRQMKELKIHPDTTYVNSRAIDGCNALESVVFPKNISWVPDYAITGCENLKQISFENESPVYDRLFSSCPNAYIGRKALIGRTIALSIKTKLPNGLAYEGDIDISFSSYYFEGETTITVHAHNSFFDEKGNEFDENLKMVSHENMERVIYYLEKLKSETDEETPLQADLYNKGDLHYVKEPDEFMAYLFHLLDSNNGVIRRDRSKGEDIGFESLDFGHYLGLSSEEINKLLSQAIAEDDYIEEEKIKCFLKNDDDGDIGGYEDDDFPF
ncbi:MAG: leucine-rich repeat domain-containing protein [Bacilli bacterium]|nr:leucine-rich repeat domain-containing protein [Bacilli bacterium]